jgi:hypothetical protein
MVVKVVAPENILSLVAQAKNDEIEFPVVALTRDPNYQIDTSRTNFTMMQKGIQTVMDTKENIIYNEKAIPITLDYSLTILTTNTIDMDEIERELLFKYESMYFLSLEIPYESKRVIRFGIEVSLNDNIERSSTTGEYLSQGQLHQSIIPLNCQGAVLLNYTPVKLKRMEVEYGLVTPGSRAAEELKSSKVGID